MAVGGGVQAIQCVGGDVHGGVEAEGDIRTENVVVNGLGQSDDVQPLLGQQL